MTATNQSQFTQTLLLFVRTLLHLIPSLTNLRALKQSQTQNGTRYTPHLTRFYTSCSPCKLRPLLLQTFQNFGVKFRQSSSGTHTRIGGYDARKEVYKGTVEIEPFTMGGRDGSFCVMKRDKVSCVVRRVCIWMTADVDVGIG